jgi:hypothetical protein
MLMFFLGWLAGVVTVPAVIAFMLWWWEEAPYIYNPEAIGYLGQDSPPL